MSMQTDEIRASVKDRFAKIAQKPQNETKFAVGPKSAKKLGYDPEEIDALPGRLTESFCGVGNPLGLGEVLPGETVLDLGCGSGFDCVLAVRRVGAAGQVIGVDMTPEMIAKARDSARLLALENVRFLAGELKSIPVQANTVDVVISNGVLNLCPDKPRVLAEAARVLRPGGRLQMADMLLEDNVTPEDLATKGEWSD